MKPLFRRLIAGLTIIGGIIVLYFELAHAENPERWFWIIVAGLAMVLGMIELLNGRKVD